MSDGIMALISISSAIFLAINISTLVVTLFPEDCEPKPTPITPKGIKNSLELTWFGTIIVFLLKIALINFFLWVYVLIYLILKGKLPACVE